MLILLSGCLLFALRMSLDIDPCIPFFQLNLPRALLHSLLENGIQCAMLLFPLCIFHFIKRTSSTCFGLMKPSGNSSGYFTLLMLVAIPVLIAAQRASFREQYPKYIHMAGITDGNLWFIGLFIFFYLIDFISIELLFRGFLLKDGYKMLLPVTAFYVSIHFGKPELETLSSFAGGYMLGVLAIHTGSIRGGIWLHMGMAAMMELAGSFT